ncbi:MAG: bifunctional DNA-formamidopyrimidine glycosylase/DNA-(apurinic or apyrimidinic site) lyase [Chloroflexia bacterium]
MPELPEVETTARALRPHLAGRTIVGIRALDYTPLIAPYGREDFIAALVGCRVQEVGRRGKHLLLGLEDGRFLAVHLGMSGRLLLFPGEIPPDRHTHAVLDLDDGRALHFCDPRKFGRMRLLSPEDYAALDRSLGPEPLSPDWTAGLLAERLRCRPRARLKALLLDQRFLAGLGNIYADEALFGAGLHPCRPAGSLSPEEVIRLHRAVREVLEEAVAAEGTTLADRAFLFGRGEGGRFAERLQVYGRAGRPCPRCGTAIRCERVAGRSSHFCPRCQGAEEGKGYDGRPIPTGRA